MDAFFASVEQRDNQKYQNKPIIVGGLASNRGVVATCSYEARKFGIKSAMPTVTALRLCPNAIVVAPRFEVYRAISKQIRAIFAKYTATIEPLSIDEAYLDVTNSTFFNGSATLIAKAIKQEISQQLNLTASAGVSYNKLLAKIASDINKPNGLTVITPKQGAQFASQLPVRKFYGVGSATEKKLHALNLKTGADVVNCSLEFLEHHFGKFAHFLYNSVRGIDNRIVKYNPKRLSVSKEVSFAKDIVDKNQIERIVEKLCQKVLQASQPRIAKTIVLKVRYSDYQLITRRCTVADGLATVADMLLVTEQLIAKTMIGKRYVRLLGIGLTNWA